MNEKSFAKNQERYTLTYRRTTEQLTEEYVTSIYDAQQIYRKAVSAADAKFLENAVECMKADNILGAPTATSDVRVTLKECLKDGTQFLPCPMVNCSSGSYKLKRHLEAVHSNLNEFQKQYAVEFSKKMSQNSFKIYGMPSTSIGKNPKRVTDNFSDRKHNPKQCKVCDKLVMNLSDHLVKVHKLDRLSPGFKETIRDSPTVPKCYTKIVHGHTVKLAGEELKEAKRAYDGTVDLQSSDLERLKHLKEKMAEYYAELNKCKDTAAYSEIKQKLAEIESEYKTLR